ncbi:MAG: hypothetical protein KAS32_30395 [Candidatus Peribacteraceae bacterium]|nr:hypothetical protein [Candidatus Peribacteraceae bacterium]
MASSYGQVLKDLQVGLEEGEKPVQVFLREHFGIKTRNIGNKRVEWDLEFAGVDSTYLKKFPRKNKTQVQKKFLNKYGRTFEIKRDKTSDRTGNFFFEVWSNIRVENPGCLNRSKADVVVIVRKKEFIFINRGYLISWIIDNLYCDTELNKKWKKKTCRRIKNPEMKSSYVSPQVRGILIPIEDIKKEAIIAVFKR